MLLENQLTRAFLSTRSAPTQLLYDRACVYLELSAETEIAIYRKEMMSRRTEIEPPHSNRAAALVIRRSDLNRTTVSDRLTVE